MEKNINPAKKAGILAGAMFLAAALGACTNGESPPEAERSGTLVLELGSVSRVFPGDAVVARSIDPDNSAALELELVEHQYPHGRDDSGAPVVTEQAMRVDAHVALSGSKSNYLDNDAGCDTLRVDNYRTAKSLGILSLGAVEDAPILMWPKINGEAGEFAYLCFFENNEPRSGAVIFVDNRDI